MVLPELKRQCMKWKQTYSSFKKRFRDQRALKKATLIIPASMKGPITIDLLEKN